MKIDRRTALVGLLGVPVATIFGQGVSSRAVKPQPKGKFSGLPFYASFTDVASAAGLHAPLIYGPTDHKTFIIETVGCGCAFVDFDNDGWLDIFSLEWNTVGRGAGGHLEPAV